MKGRLKRHWRRARPRRIVRSVREENWGEAGQSAVLLAIMFLAMLFFVGLATDGGLIYLRLTQLRRAVDAASLGAATELRGADPGITALTDAAQQYVKLQGLNPASVIVERCLEAPGDPDLCTTPARKLVRVTATENVNFVFVTMLGWNSVPITASAISEAASLEVVLLIDVSQSMIWDARPPLGTGVDDDGDGTIDEADDHDYGNASFGQNPLCNSDAYPPDTANPPTALDALFPTGASTHASTPVDSCRPFEWVRDAAMQFVDTFPQFPFDRVAIVTFSFDAFQIQDLNSGTDEMTTLAALQNLDVSAFGGHGAPGNPNYECPSGDTNPPNGVQDSLENLWWNLYPASCTNTNIGRALVEANNIIAAQARPNALRFVILLSDGETTGSAPDAIDGDNALYASQPGSPDFACHNYSDQDGIDNGLPGDAGWPEDEFFFDRRCSDGDARIRHANDDLTNYDADDYARDAANTLVNEGQTIVYTIGLGDKVTYNPTDSGGSGCTPDLPVGNNIDANNGNPDCLPNGEQLLRHIADVGDASDTPFCEKNTTYTEPIYPAHTGYYSSTYDPTNRTCGNYYYAQGGAQLQGIFDEIAQSIFTRISK